MKKFFKEFKEFISRGNIVDLAIAVIIGGAFSAIVTALTNKIIMPLVNWVLALCVGSQGLEAAYTILSPAYQVNPETGAYVVDAAGNKVLDLAASIYIDWGAFIAAIINFLIIAMTLFLIVKTINASKRGVDKFHNGVKEKIKKKKNKKGDVVEEIVDKVMEEPAIIQDPVEEAPATESENLAAEKPSESSETPTDEMIYLLREIRTALVTKNTDNK